ncbi:MAG: HDIG domain-containing protein [Candidatus Obscuribacterales bacterium]|nr:HDIG domain-containing protein [Candidatus Obscuribacterales bacterium]
MASYNAKSVTAQTAPLPVYHPEIHHDIFPTGRSFFNWLTMGIAGFLLLFVALVTTYVVRPELRAGDFAENTIKAQADTRVTDFAATTVAKERAQRGVVPVFSSDRSSDKICKNRLEEIFNNMKVYFDESGWSRLDQATKDAVLAHASILTADRAQLDAELNKLSAQSSNNAHLVEILKVQRSAIQKMQTQKPELLDATIYLAMTVAPEEMAAFRATVEKASDKLLAVHKRYPHEASVEWEPLIVEFLPEAWSPSRKAKTAQLMASALQPNVQVNEQATAQKAEQSAAHVAPVYRLITKGSAIVKKHQLLTQNDVETLRELGMAQTNRLPMILGLGISLLAAIALAAGVVYTFDARHLFQTNSIGLMYAVAIAVASAASLIGDNYPQFVPLPAAALVWTIFFGRRVSSALTIPLTIILAVAQLIEGRHLIALSTAAVAAVLCYTKHRNSLMLTGVVVGMTQAIAFILSSILLNGLDSVNHLGRPTIFELFAGVVSCMLAIGSLPFLESIFGMVTPFRLAEITDAEQPLLRQLEENAPGTYQHSLAVANLAEGGARAIGGDVNLVRAGALYHDIGKMARPKYFIENQLGAKNPHDDMTPEDSRERVLAHVTDGIDLAEKFHLPKAVQDFIPMHQGTSLMAYFYHKACVRDGVENVDPKFYRYPGPKPQSKETAIVMLADVSEAVTHSMHDPTQEEVEIAIDKVFQNRWEDGQFNESSLTYQELTKVRQAFVRVWRTLHHERLKYPSTTTGRMAIAPEMNGQNKASTNQTPAIEQTDSNNQAEAKQEKEVSKDAPDPPRDCCS